MDSKKMVLIGLVLTAFFSSLAVFELIPGLLMSFLLLFVGIAVTYYFALSRMRLESLAGISILLKAAKEIGRESKAPEISRLLGLWAQRLVKSEAALVWWQGEWVLGDEEFTAWPGLETAREWVKNNNEILVLYKNGGEIFSHPWPSNINSLLGWPLMVTGEAVGMLFLLNESKRGYFVPQDSEALEVICQQAAAALNKASDYQKLEYFYKEILFSMLNALDSRFPGFTGHSQRVARVAALLGSKLGLDEEELRILEYAALLHDAGKVFFLQEGLPGEAGELEEELSVPLVEEHPLLGAQILPNKGIFAKVRQGILYHHERYDGSGYPEGLSRTDIPLAARIIAVADLYDALTRLAPEEERLEPEAAVTEIKKSMGMLLDPLVVVVMEEVERKHDDIT
ncbi:MAG: HD domain-containing protein [Syntrophomonas sp.]|uniref:HD domain-containing phosphohydrolase n=1 Tax=Syntrophomonas sp. TaxID=2053627 RepID=UPI002631FA06|nr:HD domain-containing phosphohydrolase [Syntrophomonas sp.]MDD2511114.1 HD domain-containing protein [Syntrophomonas sp.]MDD3878372.1 HD domain-containing protein [Syntrophomonas sp.]MDD4625529.1 HD domain-containing protein [Syntrophomonas sp.]